MRVMPADRVGQAGRVGQDPSAGRVVGPAVRVADGAGLVVGRAAGLCRGLGRCSVVNAIAETAGRGAVGMGQGLTGADQSFGARGPRGDSAPDRAAPTPVAGPAVSMARAMTRTPRIGAMTEAANARRGAGPVDPAARGGQAGPEARVASVARGRQRGGSGPTVIFSCPPTCASCSRTPTCWSWTSRRDF